MKILGLICARGGSKGLINKNIKLFKKKPLIFWSIKKLKNLKQIDKSIISSDHKKIQDIAKKNAIDVIFTRPKNLSNSKASKIDVWKHAYKKACSYYKCDFDAVVDIDCSNPLQKLSSIKKLLDWSIKNYKQGFDFDVSLFVTESRKNPYFNMFEKKNKYFQISKKIKNLHTRQSAPKVFDHVAGTYFIQKKFLKSSKYLSSAKIIGFEISRNESFDIDDKIDFNICERLANKL